MDTLIRMQSYDIAQNAQAREDNPCPGNSPATRNSPSIRSKKLINGIDRWILALDGVSPTELRAMPPVMDRQSEDFWHFGILTSATHMGWLRQVAAAFSRPAVQGDEPKMADINLTQHEADKLMAMEKRAVDEKEWLFPAPGETAQIPLTSLDKREHFMLDLTRTQIKLTKATYQNRARQVIILMRLDLDGPPHRNPDDLEIPCPHLHIYREGYGDKWAIPAPLAIYTNTLDLFLTFEAFMQQCNITGPPRIQKGLFS